MNKITKKLNRLVRLPNLAEGATYTYFNADHLRLTTSLTAIPCSVRETLRRIDDGMHNDGIISERWKETSNLAIKMELFVREVLASDAPGFECKFDDAGHIKELIELPLGRHCRDPGLMSGPRIGDRSSLADYRPRPAVQLFLNVYKKHAVGQFGPEYFAAHPAARTIDGKQFLWQSFNELIAMIRAEARACDLDDLDRQNQSKATERFEAMMRHVRRCFTKRRRIFILRIDLSYLMEIAGSVSIEQAKEHHALFVNRLRALGVAKDEIVGGLWKIEWTQRKGHHFHWVFMLDGSLVQDAKKWAKIIDEQWKKAVPQGAGYTHVCNFDKHKAVGIGMIHIERESEKFKIFEEQVIGYLAKKDQALCLKISNGTQTWGQFRPSVRRDPKARHRRFKVTKMKEPKKAMRRP
ncbi:conserved protein of unknown function [Burkholderia multivorans]